MVTLIIDIHQSSTYLFIIFLLYDLHVFVTFIICSPLLQSRIETEDLNAALHRCMIDVGAGKEMNPSYWLDFFDSFETCFEYDQLNKNKFGGVMIDSGNIGHLYNQRLLNMASTGGSLDEILMLLNRAEIDCRNNEGMTPLHIATSRGDIQIVNILINNGAGVDKADIRGTTPLIVACSIGNVEIVNALVAANADVNKVAKHGATPLLMASYSDINHLEVIKILINNGADYYKADYNGDTPISLAKKKGHTARIQYFQDLNWQRRRSLYLMRLYEDHEENKTHSPTALGRFLIDKTDRTGQDIRRIVASFL